VGNKPGYDVFVSYRRDGGATAARLVRFALERLGYRVFLDVEDLSEGRYDERLLQVIENTGHFVVILSQGVLDRNWDASNWLHREIAHAIRTKRKIIPIAMPGFVFPTAGDLPDELGELRLHNAVPYHHTYFKATMGKLVAYLGPPSSQLMEDNTSLRKADSYRLHSPADSSDASQATVQVSERNPYLNRMMIRQPEDFFGRASEVRKVFSRLDAPHPQSIAIVGDRLIGKSSLLNYIRMKPTKLRFLSDPDRTIVILIDLQRETDMSPEAFLGLVLDMIAHEQPERFDPRPYSRDRAGALKAFEKLNKTGLRTVIMLDEFEVIASNPAFGHEFYSFIRYAANNCKIAFITSSAMDLQHLTAHHDFADSPFYNIFSNLLLRALEKDEAADLIAVPSERAGCPLQPYTNDILNMSGRFPFFIQLACSHVFDHLSQNPGRDRPDFDKIWGQFYQDARHTYRDLWSRMNGVSQETLVRIASGKRPPGKSRYVEKDLLRRGYLAEGEHGIILSSSAFRDFLLREVLPERPTSLFRRLLGRR
jgi:hypothetical protein